MAPVIYTDGIVKRFGKYSILDGLSLQIESGISYGLVGLNGAGKTTLIRILLGILKADQGTISILGHNPWVHEPTYYKQAGVVLEHDGFWGNLTVRENLKIFAAAKGISWRKAESYFDTFWKSTPIYESTKKVKFLSRGQRVQCALCRAFLGWPKVCIFDEPTVALDVDAYDHFRGMVNRAREKGTALLISSHQLDTIEDLCNKVGILRDKKVYDFSSMKKEFVQDRWMIKTDENNSWASIIKENGGTELSFRDGYWYFRLNSSEIQIPQIVSQLVNGECKIMEVRPETSDFRESIRQFYGTSPKTSSKNV